MDGPPRTTSSTFTLVDHILTNTQEYASQSGIIDIAILENSMIYYNRKISKTKCNKHKEITFAC